MAQMKKLAVFLFATLLFAGCGNANKAAPPTVVNQSQSQDPLDSEYRDAKGNFDFKGQTLRVMWDPLEDDPIAMAKIKKFEKECNAKVEIVAGGWGDSPARIASHVASGDPADLTYLYATWYPDYPIAGFLEPIDSYIPLMQSLARDDDENYFSYNETKYFQWNGDRYAFTNNKAPTHSLLFYNTTMFDEMGLEYPDQLEKRGEWTHEKFVEYAKILTLDKDGDGLTDQYGVFVELFMLTMLLTSNNADLVQLGREAGEKTRLSLQDPATIHSLTVYEQMVNDGSLGGDISTGTAAMGFRTIATIPQITENLGLDTWGFAGAPMGPQNTEGLGAGIHSQGWSIIKGSKNPVMATVFIHYLLNVAPDIIIDDPPPAFEGFRNQEEYDRYLKYMENLKIETNHVLENDFYLFMYGIGSKPLATHIKEHEPILQAALDKVLAATGVVMAGEGNPFKPVSYQFESAINPLVPNTASTTNAMVSHTAKAVRIKNDALATWDLYATTDPNTLVFEPGHRYTLSFDYTLNEAVGEEGKYYLSFVADGKKLSDSQYGEDATVGKKESYEVEFDFYDDLDGGYLQFGGFNTTDILIENLRIKTVP